MTANDTKDRILNAAERIFAEQGLEAVSLRAVTTEASVNIAAVNYYFGSKAALLQAMTQRHFAPVNAEQLHRLELLETSTQELSVEAILHAYTTPIFAMFDAQRGREWMQAKIMAFRAEPSPHINTQTESEADAEVISRYYETMRRVIPHVPADELWWRFERARNLLLANQSRRFMAPAEGGYLQSSKRDERAWLITFLVGGLQADATKENNTDTPIVGV